MITPEKDAAQEPYTLLAMAQWGRFRSYKTASRVCG